MNQEATIAAFISGIQVAQPDITLMLDIDGVIRGVNLSNEFSGEQVNDWYGRLWVDTVDADAGGKVTRMVADALLSGVSAFRQVTQLFPSGREMSMEYTTVRLGGSAGLMAVGRNLKMVAELQSRLVAAQQAMEQDYWKLREVETRYRVLFDASNEAVLLLNADTLRIEDANPAAIRAFGLSRGRDLLAEIAADERDAFHATLMRVRQHGRAPGALVHIGPDQEAWTLRASLMAGEPEPVVLVQLAAVNATLGATLGASSKPIAQSADTTLDAFFHDLPDAFIVIDRDTTIRRANRAFLDLIQVASEGLVVGERLGRWMSRPGADIAALLANLNKHGTVRLFRTDIQTDLGESTEVEISAASHPSSRPAQIALLIRDVGRRLTQTEEAGSLQSALAAIIEQTGKTSLRSLVRDAVGLVERHYIGAALNIVDGNRTAASELLGLSRQGFYKKLAQYEMEGHSKGGPASEK